MTVPDRDRHALRLISVFGDVGVAMRSVMTSHVKRPDAISNNGAKLLVALLLAGPMQPSKLQEHLGLAASILSKTISKLEGEGLVERRRNPADGRSWLIHPTERGEEMIADAAEVVSSALDDPADLADQLERFVDRVHDGSSA